VSSATLEALKSEAQVCVQTLERINERITALEAQSSPIEMT
jgi:hypothetical protein